MTHRERFLEYLARYARRDLAAIDRMLAEDVTLTDWNITVVGKAAALAETAKNFAAATRIDITPRNIMEGGCSVSAELHIVVDATIELHVVDVIDFASSGMITAIRAYRGRAPT